MAPFQEVPKWLTWKKTPIKLDADRYVSHVDNYIKIPQLLMAFPGTPRFSENEIALDCVAEILGQGKNSLLYKNLVKTQKARFATAQNPASELAGEFYLMARPLPGVELSEIEEIYRETIKEFAETGVSEEALQRFVASREASMISSLQSVGSWGGKASSLASYETLTGNPNFIKTEMKWLKSLTTQKVMDAFNKYINGKHAVIISTLPKDGEVAAAASDNYEISKEGFVPPADQYSGLVYNKAQDNFDRSRQPGPGPNPFVKVPEFDIHKLKNNIQVVHTENDETPTNVIILSIPGGQLLTAHNKDKAGLMTLMGRMMNESTENYTAAEFSSELDKLGSSISVNVQSESVDFVVRSLTKNLDATLELLEERLFRTVYKEDEFARNVKQQMQDIKQRTTVPRAVASDVFNTVLYGKDHVKAIPTLGTRESVEALTMEDVKMAQKKAVSPYGAYIVSVGDVSTKDLIKKLDFLNNWSGEKIMIPDTKIKAGDNSTKVMHLVDVEKAAQSELRVGKVTDMPYDATGEYYRTYLANYPLGGAFNSRINLNLREDKGYTYGARTWFYSTDRPPGCIHVFSRSFSRSNRFSVV